MVITETIVLRGIRRPALENMLEVIREQNMSRRVYVMYEGSHPEVCTYTDAGLVEAIIAELRSTVQAMQHSERFNRPPLTPEEHREETDKLLAAEFGYSDVEEYKKAEREWAAEQMDKFFAKHDIEL